MSGLEFAVGFGHMGVGFDEGNIMRGLTKWEQDEMERYYMGAEIDGVALRGGLGYRLEGGWVGSFGTGLDGGWVTWALD